MKNQCNRERPSGREKNSTGEKSKMFKRFGKEKMEAIKQVQEVKTKDSGGGEGEEEKEKIKKRKKSFGFPGESPLNELKPECFIHWTLLLFKLRDKKLSKHNQALLTKEVYSRRGNVH